MLSLGCRTDRLEPAAGTRYLQSRRPQKVYLKGQPYHRCCSIHGIPKFHADSFEQLLQFADDTPLISIGATLERARSRAEKGLKIIKTYVDDLKITLSEFKTEVILFGKKWPVHPFLKIGSLKLRFASAVKYVGVSFDRNLTFVPHTKRRKALAEKQLQQRYCLTKHNSDLCISRRFQLLNRIAVTTALRSGSLDPDIIQSARDHAHVLE